MEFIVATGIECSAPVIAGGLRRDELLLTGHHERFEEDFSATAAMGIRYLRYGVPFHVVAADPEHYDWCWTDRALASLQGHGLEPIVDLLHFGLPDRMSGFGDPGLPSAYLAYVTAFVERYPWVRWYTPVNEPYISAQFSARLGLWNERRRSERAFVRALDNAVTCAIEGMRVIRERRPDAMFLQSDACERYDPADPSELASVLAARRSQERSWLAFDLTYGRPLSPLMVDWLRKAGMAARRIDWFAEHGTDASCVMGLDYYEGNEHLVDGDGGVHPTERLGFAALARELHGRYRLPLMLAETNNTTDRAVAWLAEVWNDTVALVDDGLPVLGFCWYSLTDQIDWDTALSEPNGRVNSLGLVDLDRRRRPVGEAYARLARLVSAEGRPSSATGCDLAA